MMRSSTRLLNTGFATSGVLHVAAFAVASTLLPTTKFELFAPPDGRNSIVLKAAIASSASPADPPSLQQSITVSSFNPSAVPNPTRGSVDARFVEITHQGELPPLGIQAPTLPPARSKATETRVQIRRAEMVETQETAEQANDRQQSHRPLTRSAHVQDQLPVDVSAAVTSIDAKRQRGAASAIPPKRIHSPSPVYPPAALRAGITGRVILIATLDARGRVSKVTIRDSSGNESLDQAAVIAVRRWRFETVSPSGETEARKVAVPIRFQIGG